MVQVILDRIQQADMTRLLESTDVPGDVMKAVLQALHLLLGQFDLATRTTALAMAFGVICAESEGGLVRIVPTSDEPPIIFVPTFEEKVLILREVADKVRQSYLADLKQTTEESTLAEAPTKGVM